MAYCKATGVLIVPVWKLASFWPLICGNSGDFQALIHNFMYLPTNKNSYLPCRNGVRVFWLGAVAVQNVSLIGTI